MADRQPIVNIFGISGPSGNPVQSPATLYARDDRRWNSFLRQYAVWPTTGNENRSFTIYRIFDAPYTGTYYIRSSVDNSGSVFINDLKVNGTTQTIERHHWWWWGGWWGGYGYWNGYGGYWGWGGYRTTDWATTPTAYPITLGRGINQLRFEVSNSGDVAGFGMTIADTNGNVVWDTRSTAVVSEFTQTCGRYSITSPIDADIVAYLWGGGGGGGGMDAGSRGGDGAPGEFHKVNFSVEIGDVIEVVVGDGGTAGGSSAGSAGGGRGGASRTNLSGFGSFSGANGSAAGPGGSSGGGGGGGGASLVLVNNVPVAVAGGGGGGGGAGNDGNSAGLIAIRNALTAYPDKAQIFSGAKAVEVSGTLEPLNGQRGQGKNGDGGGAGGGGGGWGGGNGGTVRGGDSSSYGGQTGGNYPFNQIFKHTAGNVSFVAPSSVTSIQLLSAVAGGGGGGAGNITLGACGGGEGARAQNLTFNVVPGRLYEICIGDGGLGGNTLAGAYSGQGTITDANLVINSGNPGGFTSIRDTVTDTYLLKLGGGGGGNLNTPGEGGTVITNLSYNPGNEIIDLGSPGTFTLSTYANVANYSSFAPITSPPYTSILGSEICVFGAGSIPSGSNTRTLTTNSRIDLTNSSVITYYVNRGTESDWGQTPDRNETLNLEYSTNGTSWAIMNTVPVNIVRNTWAIRSVNVPAAARIAGGVFLRFRQPTSGGAATKRDTWAFTSVFSGTPAQFGLTIDGSDGLVSTGPVGAGGAGPASGKQSGADALTETALGSDFGCGSAGAGSDKVSIFAVDPNDQTKPQVVAKGYGGKGANGAILIRWEDDQRLGEDGELFTVSNTSWNSFLNSYGVWRKDNATQATVLRGLDTAYSGTYKIRAAATGTLMVYIDDVQVLTTTNTSAGDITSADIVLSRGIHQIRFDINSSASVKGFAVSLSDSADKLYWDTRDNIGTNPPGRNMRYYVPPYARGGTAGQEGANGAVALEIYPRGLSNVKVGGQWRNITTAAVKVSGIWRDIASIFVKVNGRWQPSGSAGDLTTLIFNQQFGNYSTDDRVGLPAPPGGGGRRCKIICTKLHDLGYLPDHIYAADELFGEQLRENDPEAYYGYIRWASVVVDWMEKDGPQCMFWILDKEKRGQAQRNLAISWARRIATPWAQHMAYKMGVEKEDSRAGRAIMKTGLIISRLIGKFSKADKPTKSVATGYAMWAVFGLFYILAGLKDKK
jgi:hypothetical protein